MSVRRTKRYAPQVGPPFAAAVVLVERAGVGGHELLSSIIKQRVELFGDNMQVQNPIRQEEVPDRAGRLDG